MTAGTLDMVAARAAAQAVGAPPMMTADVLMGMSFAPLKFIVPELLCEGLTIFAGRPKIGKSWGVLDFAIAVSEGGKALGKYLCEEGAVLLLALEDSPRRLRSRLEKSGCKGSRNLTTCVTWRRINEGGLEDIADWIAKHPSARAVIIDTLAKVRPIGGANKDVYQADSDALKELHQLANEKGIAIVVVHHTRKAAADDWLDSVSGTTGLTGVADSTIVLKRERGQADAFLFGTGRDLPDYELPLKFDEESCRWRTLDMSAAEARVTTGQAGIINALR